MCSHVHLNSLHILYICCELTYFAVLHNNLAMVHRAVQSPMAQVRCVYTLLCNTVRACMHQAACRTQRNIGLTPELYFYIIVELC